VLSFRFQINPSPEIQQQQQDLSADLLLVVHPHLITHSDGFRSRSVTPHSRLLLMLLLLLHTRW
jgi:hypothetical protein